MLFYSILAVPLSRSAALFARRWIAEKRAPTIKLADRPCFVPSPHGYVAALWRIDPRRASGESDGAAGDALCQKWRRSYSLPSLWQRAN
jgi:hypothetical protein